VLAGAAHCGPVPVGHGCGGGRCCRRLSSLATAAVSTYSCGGGGCPHCRGVRAPGCPAGHVRCPRVRTAGLRRPRRPGPLDQRRRASPSRVALPSRRNGGSGPPPSWRSRSDTAAGVWVAAEPDTADALAVRCCFRNRGRCPEGSVSRRLVSAADTSAACRCPSATGTGRPVGGRWTGAATAGRRR
jgi:hypothetical protein